MSDHSKISVRLFSKFISEDGSYSKLELDDFPSRYKWDNFSSELFLNCLKSGEIQTKIQNLLDFQVENEVEVSAIVNILQDILVLGAEKSLKKKTVKKKK